MGPSKVDVYYRLTGMYEIGQVLCSFGPGNQFFPTHVAKGSTLSTLPPVQPQTRTRYRDVNCFPCPAFFL